MRGGQQREAWCVAEPSSASSSLDWCSSSRVLRKPVVIGCTLFAVLNRGCAGARSAA